MGAVGFGFGGKIMPRHPGHRAGGICGGIGRG